MASAKKKKKIADTCCVIFFCIEQEMIEVITSLMPVFAVLIVSLVVVWWGLGWGWQILHQ